VPPIHQVVARTAEDPVGTGVASQCVVVAAPTLEHVVTSEPAHVVEVVGAYQDVVVLGSHAAIGADIGAIDRGGQCGLGSEHERSP
jgi:hypothetical protein